MNCLDINPFLRLAKTVPVIDVRSPGEFAKGHIPGAVNLPLFDDDQRAEVGKLYKHQGRPAALLCGLEIAGGKLADLARRGLEIAGPQNPDKRGPDPLPGDDARPHLLVHCWRGGLRSRSVAWLLEQIDLRTAVLEGGYRAWRRAGQELFGRRLQLIVLGGLTGSGKTWQLARLAEAGQQVIDMEGLANHRGSAFGGVGMPPQPTVEQFENLLQQRMRQLDLNRPVWVEAESQSIGRTFIPLPFFRQLTTAPMIVMNVPLQRRVQLLTQEYSQFPACELVESVEKIRKRLGGQNVNQAVAAIEQGNFDRCVEICLAYYDQSYGQGSKYLSHRTDVRELTVDDPHHPDVTRALIEQAVELTVAPA